MSGHLGYALPLVLGTLVLFTPAPPDLRPLVPEPVPLQTPGPPPTIAGPVPLPSPDMGWEAAGPAPAGVQAPYCTELIVNGGFQAGSFFGWSTFGAPTVVSTGGHTGWNSALLGGRNDALDRIWQTVDCPFASNQVSAHAYIYMSTQESGGYADSLKMQATDSRGAQGTSWAYPGTVPIDTWWHWSFSSTGEGACAPGVTWRLEFEAVTDPAKPTWFFVDDASITTCCGDDSHEPNNDFAAASAVSPGSYDLRLCPSSDEDWFRFKATAGQRVTLRLQIVQAGQATVCLVSPTGQEVKCDSASYPHVATVAYTVQASGSWRARVHDPGYQTFGRPLQLGVEIADLPTSKRLFLPAVLKEYWQPQPEDCTELVVNGGFESGLSPWSADKDAGLGGGRSGAWGGWLGGRDNTTGELIQRIAVPAAAKSVPWVFWWKAEAAAQQHDDVLRVFIQDPEPEPLLLLLQADGPLNAWRREEVDLSPYAGREFFLTFHATTDASVPTTFRVDDVSVKACVPP